ncbi:MAG: DUF5992 family protein [Oleiphilaceae bacterium]|nr:DUF5992 family protein [Oleiphilaceae bacterium]
MKKIQRTFFIICSILCTQLPAGELIRGAKVVEVANTTNNGPDFAVILEGGSGVCFSDRTVITFPESKKQSDASYQQAFSIAIAALSTGHKVRIHNFESDACNEASFILVSK